MSSFNRRVLIVSLAALAGCGFTPVYGPGGSAEGLRDTIDIAAPADTEGFALVRRLEERLGTGQSATQRLTAEIGIREKSLGILPDGTITRYTVQGQVDWTLTHIADDRVIARGSEKSFTGYAATSTTVATLFARRDARERLMRILADQVVASLISGTGDVP